MKMVFVDVLGFEGYRDESRGAKSLPERCDGNTTVMIS